jgi:hypothetical protein
VFGWGRLEPDSLPDATAGRIPDHSASVQSLLAYRDLCSVLISRIKRMYDTEYTSQSRSTIPAPKFSQLICSTAIEKRRNVNGELEIAASMECRVVAIDKYRGLVVDGSKIEQHPVADGPVLGNVKSRPIPRVHSALASHSCCTDEQCPYRW